MRLFYLKTCDTCRKAIKALAAAGHAPLLIEIRADGIPEADLDQMIAAFGDDVINRRSTTWRGLDAAERAKPARDLLIAHPTLLKRPVIELDGVWCQGWTAAVQDRFL